MKIENGTGSTRYKTHPFKWVAVIVIAIVIHLSFIIFFKLDYLQFLDKEMPGEQGESYTPFRKKPFSVVDFEQPSPTTGREVRRLEEPDEEPTGEYIPYDYSELDESIKPIEPAKSGGSDALKGSSVNTVKPKPIYIPWPEYPEWFEGEVEGKVKLKLFVDKDGKVQQVEVLKGLSHPRLTRIAVSSARRIQFTPGRLNGVPQSMWVELTIGFKPR